MNKFIEYILQFGNLNSQQIDLIQHNCSEIDLPKDTLYWEAGKTVRHIGFLTEGVIRVYFYNHKGEEITRYFIDENHLILAGPNNDELYIPSEYLSTATNCKMVVFTQQQWKDIADTIAGWEIIIHKIITKHHNEKVARRSELISQDATTRYLDFIQKFPGIINRIPLSFVASYLGITQSSLSRIRKNIH